MFYKQLFESPDYINVNGRHMVYRDPLVNQRSIIIFESRNVWISKVGDLHDNFSEYDISHSETTHNSLQGRIWLDTNIISFWKNPVVQYKSRFMKYIDALDEKLSIYGINMKNCHFDMYDMWSYDFKKTCDPALMLKYYSNENNTITEDYTTFITRLDKCLQKQITIDPSDTNIIKTPKETKTFGSPSTSWDSTNNIIKRQREYTSEGFYPVIFDKSIY